VPILAKRKSEPTRLSYKEPEAPLSVSVHQIHMRDYETHHCDKRKLRELATPMCEIETKRGADLEQVRKLIDRMRPPMSSPPTASQPSGGGVEAAVSGEGAGDRMDPTSATTSTLDFTFVDSVTAVRFFRIDRAQEALHYVIDICDDSNLYIVHDTDQEQEGDDHDDDVVYLKKCKMLIIFGRT
jgi:diacylglycerol kinase (ATP)